MKTVTDVKEAIALRENCDHFLEIRDKGSCIVCRRCDSHWSLSTEPAHILSSRGFKPMVRVETP